MNHSQRQSSSKTTLKDSNSCHFT